MLAYIVSLVSFRDLADATYDPFLSLHAYSLDSRQIMGSACFGTMMALGEMATFLPSQRGFAGYAARFFDPALGFAMGWCYTRASLLPLYNSEWRGRSS